MIRAGVAVRNVTPEGPIRMSGFAARTGPSAGVHDEITVRALVVEHTAILTLDVVGLHEDFCARVREVSRPTVDHVVLHATHTHSGPSSIPGRLGGEVDAEWLEQLEAACSEAITRAAARREPVTITAGYGADPDVARNRRHSEGPVDRSLPLVRFEREDGSALALLVSYACHPVVLSSENLLLSADYPGVVRERLETATGATTLFATSCAGDLNTGHPLGRRSDVADQSPRTFEQCELIGGVIADAALQAVLRGKAAEVTARSGTVSLPLHASPPTQLHEDAARWELRARTCSPADRPLYEIWERWARDMAQDAAAASLRDWTARVSVLTWGPAVIVTLPGEPFCSASQAIREQITALTGARAVLVLGYCDGSPGYLPSRQEYTWGGYEVVEAHRYYGMPGPFTAGSLERLVDEAVRLVRQHSETLVR